MRILYGVTGDGFGHTMRARAIGAHLIAQGHAVRFAASGKTVSVLRKHFDDVIAIEGMKTTYEGGEVKRARTVATFLRNAPRALGNNARVARWQVRDFDPDAIVTDFDAFSRACGKWLKKPVISIDHQHVLDRFDHPREVLDRISRDFPMAKRIVSAKTPSCDRYIVSSFYFPDAKGRCDRKTTLIGPVLREEIENAKPTVADHVLVYQTADGDPRLLPALVANARAKFLVYGVGDRPSLSNVEFRAFDEKKFIRDLSSARAVIANGGFSTLSEAIYLGKPVLSVPIARQPEQELNAAYLAELGLGMYAKTIDARTVAEFLRRTFAPARDDRIRSGRRDACTAIDRALSDSEKSARTGRAA